MVKPGMDSVGLGPQRQRQLMRELRHAPRRGAAVLKSSEGRKRLAQAVEREIERLQREVENLRAWLEREGQ